MIAENQRLIRVRTDGDELTCIVCPIGCRFTVTHAEDGSIRTSGNKCRRGEEYAREEYSDPRRVVTGTCAIDGGEWIRLPVRSSGGVPVDQVIEFLNALYELRIDAPIARGDVVAHDLGGSGIDLLATMSVGRKHE